jgi:hypothetical protein
MSHQLVFLHFPGINTCPYLPLEQLVVPDVLLDEEFKMVLHVFVFTGLPETQFKLTIQPIEHIFEFHLLFVNVQVESAVKEKSKVYLK